MSRTCLATLLALASLETGARAQGLGVGYLGAGSTPAGDYLRGVGVAATGMGNFNYLTAQADSINTDTYIRWNEYLYNAAKNENRENAEHRAKMIAQHKAEYAAILKRIRENPEELDLMKGDALNSVLDQLMDPRISESSFRYAEVQLPVDIVKSIPFKLAEKNEKFSMSRLSPKGNGKWPVAFQDDAFAPERKNYERALDDALEQAIEGKMSLEAIRGVEVAVEDLRRKLDKVLAPSTERHYMEARKRLDELSTSARLLKTHKIEMALGEIDKYAGTTVNDLRVFMQKYNLRFAIVETPDERRLYPELYTSLVQQRDKVVGAIEPAAK
jgi:hypothetical protein